MDRIQSGTADDIVTEINQRLRQKDRTLGLDYGVSAELDVKTTRSTITALGADADHREQIVDISTPDGTKPFHPEEIEALERV